VPPHRRIFTIVAGVHAQSAPTSPPPATRTLRLTQPSATEPAPIPLAEVSDRRGEASARLRDMLAELSSDPITERVRTQLPVLTREIDARLRERPRRFVSQRPSLDILIGIEAEWRRLRRNLSGWTRDLTNRATGSNAKLLHARRVTENLGADLRCGQGWRILRLKCFAGSKPLHPDQAGPATRSKSKERGY